MKIFADTSKIQILDMEKPNSYTDRGRYVVVINGQKQLSGNTEVEALKKNLAMQTEFLEEYRAKYYEILKALGPVVDIIRPRDNEEES